jgi:signal transduction histidine kinase
MQQSLSVLFRYFPRCLVAGLIAAFVLLILTANMRLQAQTIRFPGRLMVQQTQTEDTLLKRLALVKDTLRVEILDSLAWIYRGTDFARAMRYAQQAEKEVAGLGYPRVRAENKNYTGIIYRNLGNYAKAMECFVEARAIAERYAYKREEGYALNNIGDIYKYQRKFAEAQSFSMQALKIFKQMPDSAGMYYCCIRLGEIAQSLSNYPEAHRFYQSAIMYSASFRNEVWEAGALNRIGQVYRQQGTYPKALQAFYAALAISLRVPNDEDEQTFILVQIGKTHFAQHAIDSAITYLRRGMRLAEYIGLKQHIRDAAKTLAEIYIAERRYAEAVQFQAIEMAMNDSLYNEASRRDIEKISAKYELEKQQYAIDSLNTAQKQERLIGLVLVGGVILLVAIAILLYRKAQSEHRANEEIMRQQRVLEDQSAEIEITNATLQEQNAELAALNREKIELMGIVAHDLKNPIGAVRGLAELIANGAVESANIQEVATQIVSTGDRMLGLVANVLDSNRLESGAMRLSMVEMDILPVVEATCWQYHSAAETKNITIHYQPQAPSTLVFVDEQAIMQVLDNIISNAVKYSPHGKNVFVRIGHSSNKVSLINAPMTNPPRTNDFIRVEIQDEGEGISQEDMKRLFGKFARLSARPTGGEHSTGLGLSIVKKMVEAMNGKVWCESELGKGATFIVELPVGKLV